MFFQLTVVLRRRRRPPVARAATTDNVRLLVECPDLSVIIPGDLHRLRFNQRIENGTAAKTVKQSAGVIAAIPVHWRERSRLAIDRQLLEPSIEALRVFLIRRLFTHLSTSVTHSDTRRVPRYVV